MPQIAAEHHQDYEKVMIRDLHLVNREKYWRVKRVVGVILSALMLIALSPLFLLISLWIKLDDPKSPVFYSQMRCGRGGKLFRMYKFRTMVPNADQLLEQLKALNEMDGPAFKIRNDPRITPAGRILRATNLDELPQLWNILRGEMAFIGPRPPLPSEVAQYNEYQYQRLYVTPGLTCYWQISKNRNDIPFDKWVEMDVRYVIERSMKSDVQIFLETIMSVIKHTGR